MELRAAKRRWQTANCAGGKATSPRRQGNEDKIQLAVANPAMRIVITGYTSKPGAPEYNMALGLRRAEIARAYLVSQGIDPIRIEIATLGEGQLVVEGTGAVAEAANRRTQFRLQVADPHLAVPAK